MLKKHLNCLNSVPKKQQQHRELTIFQKLRLESLL
jgi:hypothetical protein